MRYNGTSCGIPRPRRAGVREERRSMVLKKVGVVGGGLMGSGIAQSAAQAGYDVLLAEVNQDLLDRGMQRVHGAWQMLTGKGRITADQAAEYKGRIPGTLRPE